MKKKFLLIIACLLLLFCINFFPQVVKAESAHSKVTVTLSPSTYSNQEKGVNYSSTLLPKVGEQNHLSLVIIGISFMIIGEGVWCLKRKRKDRG